MSASTVAALLLVVAFVLILPPNPGRLTARTYARLGAAAVLAVAAMVLTLTELL